MSIGKWLAEAGRQLSLQLELNGGIVIATNVMVMCLETGKYELFPPMTLLYQYQVLYLCFSCIASFPFFTIRFNMRRRHEQKWHSVQSKQTDRPINNRLVIQPIAFLSQYSQMQYHRHANTYNIGQRLQCMFPFRVPI